MIGHNVGDLYDRCVEFYPNNVAIKYGDTSYTYTEMQRKAYSLANALSKMGLKKGDKGCVPNVQLFGIYLL